MKQCYLAFQIGSMQKTVYPLLDTTTIGRGAGNTITVPDPTVSGNHAKVSLKQGVWTVEDLESANGIMIDDTCVDEFVLKSGDSFRLGRIVFTFIENETSGVPDQLNETVEIISGSIENLAVLEGKDEAKFWTHRILDVIAAIPFLANLDQVESKRLTDTAIIHGYDAGEMILREGDPGRSIYVVLSGRVRIFVRDHHGDMLELAVLEESEFFGEMSLLTGKPRATHVEAVDKSMLMELSYTSMRELIKENATVKKILLDYYKSRLRVTEETSAKHGIEERRSAPRIKGRVPVKLALSSGPTLENEPTTRFWEAVSLDISMTGILLKVPEAEPRLFYPDVKIHMEIDLPSPCGKIRTPGVVRRVKASGAENELTLIGVEFADISTADSRKLDQFIFGESLV